MSKVAQKLDRIDLSILVHLQAEGQLTNVELAQKNGLSASPCLQRVKRLEAAGLIAGYGARLNLAKLTDVITVFTEVTLSERRRENLIRFERAIAGIEELTECHLVSGGYDYLLRFVTRSVMHYQALVEGLLERDIGIAKYFSYVVLKSPIVKPGLPVEKLLGERPPLNFTL